MDEKRCARIYFSRAIQTHLLDDEHDTDSSLFQIFVELVLSYEEDGQMKAAKTVASWSMQRMLNSPWKDAYQRPGFAYQYDLPTLPFYPRHTPDFPPWCHVLENHYHTIKNECMQLLSQKNCWYPVGSSKHRPTGHHDDTIVSTGGEWQELVLFGAGIPPNASVAPLTKALLKKHAPDAVSLSHAGGGECLLSLLKPRTRLKPHCASTNVRLTCHLGLVVPSSSKKACALRVKDTWKKWKEGECIVFDDSYEHEVVNDTDETRIVLLLRFWHPALPRSERKPFLEQVIDEKGRRERRRYVPPMAKGLEVVERRGLGETKCSRCNVRERVEVVRYQDDLQYSFICSCGEPIITQH